MANTTLYILLTIIIIFAFNYVVNNVYRSRTLLRDKRKNTFEKWDFVELLKDYKEDDLKLNRGDILLVKNNFWMNDYGERPTYFERADIIDVITENGKRLRFINKSNLLLRVPFKDVSLKKRKQFYSNDSVKYDIPEERIRL